MQTHELGVTRQSVTIAVELRYSKAMNDKATTIDRLNRVSNILHTAMKELDELQDDLVKGDPLTAIVGAMIDEIDNVVRRVPGVFAYAVTRETLKALDSTAT